MAVQEKIIALTEQLEAAKKAFSMGPTVLVRPQPTFTLWCQDQIAVVNHPPCELGPVALHGMSVPSRFARDQFLAMRRSLS